ncbi:hypothetical protein F0L68_11585 [Solihabitans fulvus]|uniref:Uncharacterized protein n=1 Tax=Solihabitans fulvus TaxID=1892852 RepID=A0A5B2XGB9_9PSEU|nr:hypothetical protein [Solihabitans fulvus]KAA2262857.1 hypothetical protein F0L68_11585 [Solihabitans fulvus]
MPAIVVAEPLGIACVFSDGRSAAFTLAPPLRTRLARDLLAGLAEMVHPHGTVDSGKTVDHYMVALRDMAGALHAGGFTGGAADLSRPRVAEYWMGTTYAREAATRQMLASLDIQTGCLQARTRALVNGRPYNQPPSTTPLAPYSDAEWSRLISACRDLVDAAFAAHTTALAAAAAGRDPREAGWSPDNVRWLLTHLGPVTGRRVGEHVGVCGWTVLHSWRGLPAARAELFPESDVVLAYRLLFGAYSGIVPDGIDALGLSDIDWAGDASVLLSYVKRRTAAESLTLPKPAVRLLTRWLEHSALLRQFAPPELGGELWLRYCANGSGTATGHAMVRAGKFDPITVTRWVARRGLTADDGGPLPIRLHRIRTTFEARRDRRAWNGSARATIDPNHSPQVEGDHYLSAATAAQRDAVDAIIEDAQADMLRRAHPPTVLTAAETDALVRDYPRLVTQLGLDDTVIAELVGGQRDVFTAACADQLAGLHGPKGQPCPARPWVCLLCPLAVFTPRHAANLLRLKAFFARQWRQMPAEQFMAVFGPYAQRVEEILHHYATPVLTDATGQVADTDTELPALRPEETTS